MSLRFQFRFFPLPPLFSGKSPLERIKTWAQKAKQFYREVRTETNNVTWPGRREVARTTVIVIFVIFVFGIYLFIADELSLRAIGRIMKRFGAAR